MIFTLKDFLRDSWISGLVPFDEITPEAKKNIAEKWTGRLQNLPHFEKDVICMWNVIASFLY